MIYDYEAELRERRAEKLRQVESWLHRVYFGRYPNQKGDPLKPWTLEGPA